MKILADLQLSLRSSGTIFTDPQRKLARRFVQILKGSSTWDAVRQRPVVGFEVYSGVVGKESILVDQNKLHGSRDPLGKFFMVVEVPTELCPVSALLSDPNVFHGQWTFLQGDAAFGLSCKERYCI